VSEKRNKRYFTAILTIAPILIGVIAAGVAFAQDQAPAPAQSSAPYKPQFAGDPARSESEAQALGYMRVVLRAEHEYKKRHDKFTDSLESLAGTGSNAWRTPPTAETTRRASVRTLALTMMVLCLL